MKLCWNKETSQRPTFVDLKKRFVKTLSEKNAYTHIVSMDEDSTGDDPFEQTSVSLRMLHRCLYHNVTVTIVCR